MTDRMKMGENPDATRNNCACLDEDPDEFDICACICETGFYRRHSALAGGIRHGWPKRMIAMAEKALAEDELATCASLLERLDLYVDAEEGFVNEGQRVLIKESARLMRTALAAPRSPTALVRATPVVARDDPDWAAHCWIDGHSSDLEEALDGLTTVEIDDVEERAAWLLTQTRPGVSWEPHQHYLYLRIEKKLLRRAEQGELLSMPRAAANRFREYRKFRAGQKDTKRRFTHAYSSREKVRITGETGNVKGYVCHETPLYVSLVDDAGLVYYKRKTSITRVPVRELVAQRIVREYQVDVPTSRGCEEGASK